MEDLPKHIRVLRKFIGELLPHIREIVAYKAAWKLLFNEELKNAQLFRKWKCSNCQT